MLTFVQVKARSLANLFSITMSQSVKRKINFNVKGNVYSKSSFPLFVHGRRPCADAAGLHAIHPTGTGTGTGV